MRNYGICYQGSKNKIADKIINLFPPKTNLYDLFAGGCSITHAALLSRKFENVYTNDLNPAIINLFKGAIKGDYTPAKRPEWISKEEFFKLKDTDPYIFFCWSFGNMGKTYLYSEEIEPYKKALHYAIIYNDFTQLKGFYPDINLEFLNHENTINGRRLAIKKYFQNNKKLLQSAQNDGLTEIRLQSLERLESRFTSLDYADIEIKPDSVIYCDIPYEATEGYNNIEFDYQRFYSWAKKQSELLLISSYDMPENLFICVAEIPHRCTLAQDKTDKEVVERVFIPRHQEQLYLRLRPEPTLFDDMF